MSFKFRCCDIVKAGQDIPMVLETQEQMDFLNKVGTVRAYQLGGYMLIEFKDSIRRLLVNEKYYELWTQEKDR